MSATIPNLDCTSSTHIFQPSIEQRYRYRHRCSRRLALKDQARPHSQACPRSQQNLPIYQRWSRPRPVRPLQPAGRLAPAERTETEVQRLWLMLESHWEEDCLGSSDAENDGSSCACRKWCVTSGNCYSRCQPSSRNRRAHPASSALNLYPLEICLYSTLVIRRKFIYFDAIRSLLYRENHQRTCKYPYSQMSMQLK